MENTILINTIVGIVSAATLVALVWLIKRKREDDKVIDALVKEHYEKDLG